MFTVRRAPAEEPTRPYRQGLRSTFGAGDERDALSKGFGILAVFDEERLPPAARVQRLLHQVEVLSYVREGNLTWRARHGRAGTLRSTEFQRRVASRDEPHREANASRTDWAQLFRIGFSSQAPLGQALAQRCFTVAERRDALFLVASRDGRGTSVPLVHDALVYSAVLDPGHHLIHELGPGRGAWLHVVQGSLTLDDQLLTTGDAAGAWSERSISFTAREPTEVLLLDLGPPAASTWN